MAGPTTLAACLNALQMGFRTLAIQKKSGEVWKVLGSVKKQFGDFGALLDAAQRKIDEASGKLRDVTDKTQRIARSLERMESLPKVDEVPDLLPGLGPPAEALTPAGDPPPASP